MNDKLARIMRTAMQGFVSGAVLALAQSQFDLATITNVTIVKGLVFSLVLAGVTGAVSAIHNLLVDPSFIPSLAPKEPAA